METRNKVYDPSFDATVDILVFLGQLEEQKKYVLSYKMLKTASSEDPSTIDSIKSQVNLIMLHKLESAAKQTEESEYMLHHSEQSQNHRFSPSLIAKVSGIKMLLSSIMGKIV